MAALWWAGDALKADAPLPRGAALRRMGAVSVRHLAGRRKMDKKETGN